MSRAKGNIAEDRACGYLDEQGFLVVERNYYAKFGELDIIATKDGIYHFIEVKSGEALELALQNLTPRKISRVIKTAQLYMKQKGLDVTYSIDAVCVMPQSVELIENVTI